MYQDIRNRKVEVYDGKVRPVFEELISYGYGYKALANALNERGVLSLKGKRWTPDAVKHTLARLGLKTLGGVYNAL
ncbi:MULTISPECIES: recombinase family protein [Serratia]|uniref:Recombinase n=1 Tax=Serratia odorifera TaxID=618 RepID=A0A447KUS5_SEROD|nr:MULTISPECIES: recombinase family protein [Serratia]PNK90200.1 hypothetical protein CEQ31_011060 [Serratia odorifera]RII71359.1 hypothetical protein DX901_15265 [Serratia odorifera]VDZ60547.1 Recombinase [Serratia odorifera]